jgi:tRNA threonylcarbamoyladenosine biosynthesis protein TsaB
MKLLAFDTSTELISIAVTRLVDGAPRLWQHTGAGGAQASSALIPAIETLMAEAGLKFAELDAIAFGRGPGSFTGLRTACAVAQGLGFGAGVPLLPVDALLAVAEEARAQQAPQWQSLRLLALLDARMGELYAAPYVYAGGRWQQQADFSLLKPEQLAPGDAQALAGNVFAEYAERLPLAPDLPCWPVLPTAAAMLRLAPDLLVAGNAVAAADALPRYIRDKVALTTQERAAVKAGADTR